MGKLRKRCILLSLLAIGCNNGDVDRLGRVARVIATKFDGITGGAKEKLAGGLPGGAHHTLGEAVLEHRVSTRIRWDHQLSGAEIDVEVAEPGVVRLRGTVATLADRRRAVELAQSTAGVDRVVDALAIGD